MSEGNLAAPNPPALGPRRGSWRPRSIRAKATISLVIIAAIGLGATGTAHLALRRLDSKITLIESFYELNQKVLETRRYEKNFLIYGTTRDLQEASTYFKEVREAIAPVEGHLSTSRQHSLMPKAQELDEYQSLLSRLRTPGLPEEEKISLKEDLRSRGQDLTAKVLEVDGMARARVESEARRYYRFSYGIVGLNIVISLAAVLLLIHWIMRPLDAIRQAVGQVMRGELASIPLAGPILDSEEGEELVNTLNRMLETLAAKQNQLLQSAKLAVIGRVTAGIAHEINNPLNNISLTAEVLLEDLPSLACAERLEMVKDVLVQADRAREVVRHLLDFSRAKKPAAWEPVDLANLAENALALLKNQLRINHLKASTTFPDQPIMVSGNPNQLEQVVVNIVLNAIQASPQGGTVSIAVGMEGEKKEAWIAVDDSGPGIPEPVRQQLFEPFFTTKSEGTGLGLSVSYAIIREHSGEIVVHNRPEGGASFRIVLPLAG